MSPYLIEQIEKTPTMEVWPRTSLVEVQGETRLTGITVECSPSGEKKKLPASSLFIFIGAQPRTEWLGETIERDERGFILSGPDLLHAGKRPASWTLHRDPWLLETNLPPTFVLRDVPTSHVHRFSSGIVNG